MAKKIHPTPQLLADILARIPEGIVRRTKLGKRIVMDEKVIREAIDSGLIGRENGILYDPHRLTLEQACEVALWGHPAFPYIKKDGSFADLPVVERIQNREKQLSSEALALINRLGKPPCNILESLCTSPDEQQLLEELITKRVLRKFGNWVFDPLRISSNSVQELQRQALVDSVRDEVITFLREQPKQIVSREVLEEKFGSSVVRAILGSGEFDVFTIELKYPPYQQLWVYFKENGLNEARQAAREATKLTDESWEPYLQLCGDVLRSGARDGKNRRMRVIARTYTLNNAAKRLRVHDYTIQRALDTKILTSFSDPEGTIRIPATQIEAALQDPALGAKVTGSEVVKAREIALVTGLSYSAVRYRLKKANISRLAPTWGQIYGKWDLLPATLREFREILKVKKAEWREERREAYLERERELEEQRELERQERAILRARLVAAFPTWRHDGRGDQRIFLHLGPPNSGKTYEALQTLIEAGSGWYLAPLRLLAYEVFDRLNQDGVYCSLLTGEEYIPVPGASIVAATIEMFNTVQSGNCVIIDEAQMLADPDRGWAWTRALMESQAPEIHVIGPPTVQGLIERLARAAAIPITLVEHERLAPIKVADRHWPLSELPKRTILVAFSRRTVLDLKLQLESMKYKVSVIYGNLPPEVRRRQADRFADGQTDICVATDAVGMGLNLPADYVCFFEVEKYDGQRVRSLTSGEVQQIGGRAGRYGLSKVGEVGATTKANLKVVRGLFNAAPATLTHARVAPSVEDLEMLPGNLANKLQQWASLQSIPESLKGAIRTADMSERIELAQMLTDEEVEQLGLEAAIKVVNAPTRQSTRAYWRQCVSAILEGYAMPLPEPPPEKIMDDIHLEMTETSIASADIYLWLSHRREFNGFGPDILIVRGYRSQWSTNIDAALLRRIDSARVCSRCRKRLSPGHAYPICDECYYNRFNVDNYYEDYF